MTPTHPFAQNQTGFTLLEIAVVLVILGILLGGLITPLSTQRDLANQRSADTLIEEVQTALIGYAIVYGRLPCPATAASSGAEAPLGGGTCTLQHGFVPARTLGLNGHYDANNLLLDSWNNPLKYSLSNATGTNQYSTNITLPLQPSTLKICRNTTCAATEIIADQLIAVIISRGKDGSVAPVSTDQLRNYKPENNTNNEFIVHEGSELVGSEYDDVVHWISPAQIALPLVKAGVIP